MAKLTNTHLYLYRLSLLNRLAAADRSDEAGHHRKRLPPQVATSTVRDVRLDVSVFVATAHYRRRCARREQKQAASVVDSQKHFEAANNSCRGSISLPARFVVVLLLFA